MDPNSALAELGKQIGLNDLKLDENGVCRLIFDDTIVVDMEASEDMKALTLHGKICDEPPEGRLKLYEAVLGGSCFGLETGGSAFGIDDGEVLLWRVVDMEKVDYQDFVNILESFVNHQEMWMERVSKMDLSEGYDQDDDDDDDGHASSAGDENMTFIRA